METETERLQMLISSAISYGMAVFCKRHLPDSDFISLNKSELVLRMFGYSNPRKVMSEWRDKGYLTYIKNKSRNSKIMVSTVELQKAIMTDKAHDFIG